MIINLKNRPLAYMPYAQARVYITSNGTQILQSYNTLVASCTPDGFLYVRGLYSQTTRRHISAFVREFGICYQCAKDIAQMNETSKENVAMNIYTGELVDIETII